MKEQNRRSSQLADCSHEEGLAQQHGGEENEEIEWDFGGDSFDVADRLQAIVEAIPGGVAVYRDADGRVETLRYSDGLLALTGYTAREYESYIHGDVLALVCEDDRPKLKKKIEKVVASKGVLKHSCRIVHKSGKLVGVHINAKMIGYDQGLPVWYAVFMGMSEESRIYQDIANRATNGIYVVRKSDHSLLYLNDRLEKSLARHDIGECLGCACYRVFRKSDSPCSDCPVFFGGNEGRPCEIFIGQLGKYFSVSSHSVEWEGEPSHVVYISDISEEKRINTEIQRIYNNIPGAVFQCRFDKDWTVISANDGLFDFLGYSREEFVAMGNRMSSVIYPQDLIDMAPKIEAQLELGKTTVANENRLICKDGSIKWISIKAQLMVDARGDKFFYCVFIDITKQKEVEAKLLESRENLAVSMDHANVFYWDYDCARKIAYFSKPMQELFNVPEACENFPDSFLALGFVSPAHQKRYREGVCEILAGAPCVEFEAQISSAKSDYVWYRLRFTGIQGEGGENDRAVCTAEPIAEYKDLEMRFATVLKQNDIGTWIYDIKGHRLPKYAGLDALYSLEEGEVENVPQSLIEKNLFHPDDVDKIKDLYRSLDEGEMQVTATVRFWDSSVQQYLWKRYSYTVIPDRLGHAVYALGSAVDVTEQMREKQKYENALRARYGKLGENVVLAGHCNITQDAIEEMEDRTGLDLERRFGLRRESFFVGLGSLVPRESQRTLFYETFLREGIERNYRMGITQHSLDCELSLSENSDATIWVSVCIDVAKSPENNDLIGFLTVTDITSRKMQTQVLDATVRFDYDYIARLNINAGTMVMYQSKGVGDQLDGYDFGVSYSYEQAVEHTIAHYVVDEDKDLYRDNMSIDNLRRQLNSNDVYEFTYRMREYTGEVCAKRARFLAYDKKDQVVVFSRADITDLVEEEMNQRRALGESLALARSANKSKSDFLSAMSHDIRTPMNAIIGMCDLALADQGNAEQVGESLAIIKNSSNLLLSLINDILDMSRIESGKITLADEGFSVAEQIELARSTLKPLADKKEQQVELFCDIKHDACSGDVVHIHRIVDNIFSNAVKFTPKNGKITCRITESASRNKNIGIYRVEISDTGIGMTAEDQKHVFDPFYRADNAMVRYAEGTGLGLPIAKSMVDYMGGTITLHSALGAGTTLMVELPLRFAQSEPNAPAQALAADFDAGHFSGARILLCEDHLINQKVAKRILEKVGISVVIADDGQAGYDLFARSKLDEFQVVLMDIQMPVMNGYEAARAIRESTHPQARNIPILAMTANAFAEDVRKCLDAGMNDHLAKPIEPQKLYEVLGRYIGHSMAKNPKKLKVLFVDDVKANVAVLSAAVQDEFEVLVAYSGEEALRVMDNEPEVAAVVTDVMMPNMDGLTLIRTLRADSRFQSLAILANTQYGDAMQEEQLFAVGADDFLYKPTTPHVVQARLHSVLRKHGKC